MTVSAASPKDAKVDTPKETYDKENVFAKILDEKIPTTKVWENRHVIAILDLFPVRSFLSTTRNAILDLFPVRSFLSTARNAILELFPVRSILSTARNWNLGLNVNTRSK
jgi:hypothetical protein